MSLTALRGAVGEVVGTADVAGGWGRLVLLVWLACRCRLLCGVFDLCQGNRHCQVRLFRVAVCCRTACMVRGRRLSRLGFCTFQIRYAAPRRSASTIFRFSNKMSINRVRAKAGGKNESLFASFSSEKEVLPVLP